MIQYGKQHISQDDIDAVVSVLKSDFLTQGPQVPLFESRLSQFTQAKYAIAVNSATSALHIACLALGVGKGDRVWTSPITFVASANCALYCDASVDFVDVEMASGRIDVDKLRLKLTWAKEHGCLPKVVIPVHLAGHSCDMKAIALLSKEYGFKVIEDASHCIGARYRESPVGSCQYSDITVFSFHPVKIITTAEGGAATTNDAALAKSMQLLRSHGVTRSNFIEKHTDEPWYYEQQALGFNYRMTEIQAVLGVSQFDKLEQFVSKRHAIAAYYAEKMLELGVSFVSPYEGDYSSWHLMIILLPEHVDRGFAFHQLRAAGIGVNVHYIPVHTQPYYQKCGFKVGDFPIAEAFYKRIVTLPLHPQLEKKQLDFIIEQLTLVICKKVRIADIYSSSGRVRSNVA
ncbi:UDP-4-amino-4,6-dideoxy-N-acetyl-beta-L-altrosamine transaminase [Shewanella schlegeliana]|uniref:UDP-4-amino-4, 6-dideoxy-N-acetyl-beta-L-altrosamine transaminase n=1 Tax=Shewanella schlegeliana TaxID=190308 RepID=A0ABS1T0B9_9GAMM|nr:UDP-4-amino-4,6-dideoxy-N-acetyl-beta-L-altrosamine transaminase [Shewanella schlegeliana]MBL4914050.1 UDP-4-amino-4,6-dideoxy-N-acetyl-beta-L-altrosamine transaminase [Shewanella schlegeliana]MCL1110911.1 UDP-4-amino-4,6-dideoxy-N-acetyl-beta-L-altrosamine transaminase [Shewanella schlegeliana]GIU34839.1 UDP-4-amino-4,6-dideoxy-N-acetyl-beta-L-altrosami ne transaminase [Shewanella schlegeliana]